MRWEGRRQSNNVEDRRNVAGPVMVGGGLFTILIMIVMMFLGAPPEQLAKIAAPPALSTGNEGVAKSSYQEGSRRDLGPGAVR